MASSTIMLPGLSGGVNQRDPVHLLEPDQCIKMENVILNTQGGAAKRLGCEYIEDFSASGSALSAGVLYPATGTPQFVVHTTVGEIVYSDDFGATWAVIDDAMSTSAPFSFEEYNHKLYMSNGVDDYRSWDGTTQVTYPAAPKGKYLRAHKDSMWVSGVTAYPDRVYKSVAADPETYNAADWVDILHGNGDVITALASDGNFLIVFKRKSISPIYDPVTFENRVVDPEKGCEGHFSCVLYNGQVFFLSRRGICVFYSDQPSTYLSGNISPTFNTEVLNYNALATAWAYAYDDRIGWCLPELASSVPTFQVEFYPHMEKKPWNFHRMPVNLLIPMRYQDDYFLYGPKKGSYKWYKAFASATGTDDSVAFSTKIQTGWFDLGEPGKTKYIRRLRVLGRGKFWVILKVDFKVATVWSSYLNLSEAGDIWEVTDDWDITETWGLGEMYSEPELHPDVYARYISVCYQDSETGTDSEAIYVGNIRTLTSVGEWAVHSIAVEPVLLGVRQ